MLRLRAALQCVRAAASPSPSVRPRRAWRAFAGSGARSQSPSATPHFGGRETLRAQTVRTAASREDDPGVTSPTWLQEQLASVAAQLRAVDADIRAARAAGDAAEVSALRSNQRLLMEERLLLLERALPPDRGLRGARLPARPDLAAWSEAMRHDAYTSGDVVLPEGVTWPTLQSRVLFVRDLYAPLYEDVLHALRPHARADTGARVARAALRGTPGIGKSAFGLYALFRTVRDGRAVVYASAADATALVLVFFDGAVREAESLDDAWLQPLLAAPDTALICDSLTPPACNAFTLTVAPSRNDRWRLFNKEEVDCRVLYLPVFTLDEICACRDACFPHVDDDGMMARFARWGGIPRYVLAKLRPEDQQLLEEAVNRATLDSVVVHALDLGLSDEAAMSDMTHRLLHIKVAGELDPDTAVSPSSAAYYRKARCALASKHVAELVVHAALELKHAPLLAILHGTAR